MRSGELPNGCPAVPLAWRAWLSLGVWAGTGMLLLSALRLSHAAGWTAWSLLGLAVVAGYRRTQGAFVRRRNSSDRRGLGFRATRHFRRWPARGFLLLALAGGIGGALYEPTNWDTQWYRLPRVLHWLAEGRWHFIPTLEGRLNYVAPGLEWLWTPLVAWTGSDQWVFLPNLASFLLLPGAAWAAFRELGVAPRPAWWAAWLLPSAWIFCLQTGSAANDALSAPYLLMAVALALRAARLRQLSPWLWSMIAAALFSNVKQSNLPLGLLWFVPALAGLRLALRAPLTSVVVALIAIAISFVPVTVMNLYHTGHWMGWSRAEQTWVPQNHAFALAANSVLAACQSAAPPVLPWSSAWNHAAHQLSTGPLAPYVVGFEDFGRMPGAISETWAGVGLPWVLLWGTGWVLARRASTRRPRHDPALAVWNRRLIGPLLLFFLSQTGTFQLARYLAPYYPFLLAPLLVPAGWGRLLRTRAWALGATLVWTSSLLLVLGSRQRPVVPPPRLTAWLAGHAPGKSFWTRLAEKQQTQLKLHRRFDAFLPRLTAETVIGFAALSPGEVSLWKPFLFGIDPSGSRRVRHLRPSDDLAALRRAGMRYAVQNDTGAMVAGARDGLDWAIRLGGRVIAIDGLTENDVLARRMSPHPPTLDDLARNRPGPDGRYPVDAVYLVEWGAE